MINKSSGLNGRDLRQKGNILYRIGARDTSAVNDCIDTYWNWIWGAARKWTNSKEGAEALAEKIFWRIWQIAERSDSSNCGEQTFIAMIAKLEIREHLRQSPGDNVGDKGIEDLDSQISTIPKS